MFVVTRHRVNQSDLAQWLESAKTALAPLADRPGCISADIGCATDDANLVTIVTRWEGVGAYRRALSSFEVKALSIPFLSTAIDEPSAFEVVHHRANGIGTDSAPARAFDADEIGLGHAAAAHVDHRAQESK
jgi:quinol monooxygenase YgiN